MSENITETARAIQGCPMVTGELKDIANLATKLAKVMGKISRLEKRGHNARFNYDYVLQEDVYDAIRAAMAEEKLAFISSMSGVDTRSFTSKSGGSFTISRAMFHFTFVDGDTGAMITTPWIAEGMDDQDKSLTKSSAQAAKYFLLRTFIMSTGETDPDGDGGTGDQTQGDKSKAKTNKPATPSNGNKPTQEPDYLKMTAGQAAEKLSPGGNKIGTLSDDQLLQLIDSNNDKVTDEMKHAAGLILTGRHLQKEIEGQKA